MITNSELKFIISKLDEFIYSELKFIISKLDEFIYSELKFIISKLDAIEIDNHYQ